jgi:hypothetical protein
MSQDLLAEFGDFAIKDTPTQNYTTPQTQSSRLQSNYGSNTYHTQTSSIQARAQDENIWDDDDDDDFGEFEEPESQPQQSIPITRNQAPTPPVKEVKPAPKSVPQPVSRPEPKPAPKPAPQPVSKPASKPTPQPAKKSSGPPVIIKKATKASQLPSNHPMARFADILFDADEYDEEEDAEVVGSWGDEDDFGDFETSEAPAISEKPTKSSPAPSKSVKPSSATVPASAIDLLGLDDPVETTNSTSHPSGQASAPKSKVSTHKSPVTRPGALPRQESILSNDDAWDDFEISPPTQSTQPSSQTNNISEEAPQIQLPTDILGDLTTLPITTGVAPSNIPPPSVLLSIFPSVLTSLAHQFLHPLSTLPSSQKSHFLSTTETKSFLASYITLTHVLGHILAGRKSRWKRDKHLAQSMSIGPATSGRSGGMKLAGLDKSEAGREDTEAQVVLSVWREQAGRLKTAVTGASVHGSKLTVPELGEALPVRVAKGSEGAITSTQACALCGLKREERVAKVDVAVEDSFGEFWVEGTNMHRSCLRFWELFKTRLMSR